MMLTRIRGVILIVLGAVLIAGVALNFINVAMRYFLGSPFPWTEETMTFGLIFLVMVGTVIATADNNNLKIDIFLQLLPGRAASAFYALSNLIWAAISVYLAVQSNTIVEMMMRFGQKSPAAGVPMWIPHSFVFGGFCLCAVAAIIAAIREIRAMMRPVDTQPGT